ncbi:MAG: hypothetical protein ACT4PJ_17330 [Gemmatimonadaceae bacterium]
MRRRRNGEPRRDGMVALHRALDETRFGRERTLNLRASLPRPKEAEARCEAWLRERQVAQSDELLVITGRGVNSWDGESVVREAIVRLLASLRRRGVVAAWHEHTPGSFVVTVAPIRALTGAPRRSRERRIQPSDPEALRGLAPATRARLRELAQLALEQLGVRDPRAFIEDEMVTQYTLLARGVPTGPDYDRRLLAAIDRAIEEHVAH